MAQEFKGCSGVCGYPLVENSDVKTMGHRIFWGGDNNMTQRLFWIIYKRVHFRYNIQCSLSQFNNSLALLFWRARSYYESDYWYFGIVCSLTLTLKSALKAWGEGCVFTIRAWRKHFFAHWSLWLVIFQKSLAFFFAFNCNVDFWLQGKN